MPSRPNTIGEALQQMRFMWFAIALTIPLYVYAGGTLTELSWLTFRNAGRIITILVALNLTSFWWTLRRRYLPALAVLRSQRNSVQAVRRWMRYWTMLLCSAESVVVLGVVFRLGGKTLRQSLAFYVIGSLLILSLWPRRIESSTEISAQ